MLNYKNYFKKGLKVPFDVTLIDQKIFDDDRERLSNIKPFKILPWFSTYLYDETLSLIKSSDI